MENKPKQLFRTIPSSKKLIKLRQVIILMLNILIKLISRQQISYIYTYIHILYIWYVIFTFVFT